MDREEQRRIKREAARYIVASEFYQKTFIGIDDGAGYFLAGSPNYSESGPRIEGVLRYLLDLWRDGTGAGLLQCPDLNMALAVSSLDISASRSFFESRRWCGVCRKYNAGRLHRCDAECRPDSGGTFACPNCCTHPRCNCCNRGAREICAECGRSTSHCECYRMGSIDSDETKQLTYPYSGSRMAGLEVEFNRLESETAKPVRAWAKHWNAEIHSDGSCGWECVTAPAAGPYLTQQVGELCAALNEAKAVADVSCGVHVHVDARDLDLHAIRRLCYIYGRVEPILYAVAGQNRSQNTYCKPNGLRLWTAARKGTVDKSRPQASNKQAWVHDLMRNIYFDRSDNRQKDRLIRFLKQKPHKKNSSRYVGMNLCPWVAGRIGKAPDTTIEFRIHKNCLDSNRLLEWAKLCIALVDFARNKTWAEMKALPKDAARAMIAISPGSRRWIVRRLWAWRNDTKCHSRKVWYATDRRIDYRWYIGKRKVPITVEDTIGNVDVDENPTFEEIGF